MSVVLDSCGWINYFGDGLVADEYAVYIEADVGPVVPTIVAFEVHRWALREVGKDQANQYAIQLMKGRVVPQTLAISLLASDLSVKYQLPACDALIYATAQVEGLDLVTSDEHFEHLPGVLYIPYPDKARPKGSTKKGRRAARRVV